MRVFLCLAIATFAAAHAQTFVCPVVAPIDPGRAAAFSLKLTSPAPIGGVFLTLDSSDPSKATVTPAAYIGAGDLGPSTSPMVAGVAAGSAIITVKASGWPLTKCTVYVGAGTSSSTPSNPGNSADTQAPSAPSINLTIVKGPAEVSISWTASSDNVAVSGYQVIRNGASIGAVPSSALSYTDTGVTGGSTVSYMVKAYDAAGNYSSASNVVSITTPTPTQSVAPCTCISSCRPITQTGRYALAKDLVPDPNSPACIRIDQVAGVQLDCLNHSITLNRTTNPTNQPAIEVSNSSDLSLANCTIKALNNTPGSDLLALLTVTASPRASITGNRIQGGYAIITNSDNTLFSRNTSNGNVAIIGGNSHVIEYNTIALESSRTYHAALELDNSSGSYIQYNSVDGGWPGGLNYGADDGIIHYNLNTATIRGNTISNVWDCGIESSGPMFNVSIQNNRVSGAKFCGFGGWYANSMKSSVVDGNTVTDTPLLFYYRRLDGLATYANETVVYFQDNVFSNNKLVAPRVSISFPNLSAGLNFRDLAGIPSNSLIASNNRVTGNDFGPLPVQLVPSRAIADGGGNLCVTDPLVSDFPLRCGR